MDRQIQVNINPGENILNQYVRKLLLDSIRGTKELVSNEYLITSDLFKNDSINNTGKPITLFFRILNYDNSFPISVKNKPSSTMSWEEDPVPVNHVTPISNYRSILMIFKEIKEIKHKLMQLDLDTECSWDDAVFYNLGHEMEALNIL